MNEKFTICLVLVLLLFMSGCIEGYIRDPSAFDSLVDTIGTLSKVNSASAPINPYATPIHIGLAGICAILEALRRKERSGRKHAEQELNGNGKS